MKLHMWSGRRLTAVAAVLALAACGTFGQHVVRKGETLYSISWRYGLDYREVAAWNGLPPPYVIREGQRLRLTPPTGRRSVSSTGSLRRSVPAETTAAAGAAGRGAAGTASSPAVEGGERDPAKGVARKDTRKDTSEVSGSTRAPDWTWPARGRLIGRFARGEPGRKGIDIAGAPGTPVRAAAAGRVVYSGNGIPRYGNLLIIKHNDKYLSAYAHNRRLLVQEGAVVKRGQQIAEMGRSGTGVSQVMLHFEIRVDGEPVDPLAYLPPRKAVTSRVPE